MSETIAHIANKNSRNALLRIDDLERAVKSIAESANAGFEKQGNQIETVSEIVSVIMELVGAEEVNKRLTAKRDEDEARRVTAAKEQIAAAVEAGQLAPAEVVPAEHALLVFTEKLADGTPLKYGSRVQFALSSLRPEVRSQVVGQKAGFSFPSPEGHLFEVAEVYTIVPPKPAPTPAPEAKTEE